MTMLYYVIFILVDLVWMSEHFFQCIFSIIKINYESLSESLLPLHNSWSKSDHANSCISCFCSTNSNEIFIYSDKIQKYVLIEKISLTYYKIIGGLKLIGGQQIVVVNKVLMTIIIDRNKVRNTNIITFLFQIISREKYFHSS